MTSKQAGIALIVITVILQLGIFLPRGEAFATFITKTDIKDILQPIMERLARIEQKIDRYMEK